MQEDLTISSRKSKQVSSMSVPTGKPFGDGQRDLGQLEEIHSNLME